MRVDRLQIFKSSILLVALSVLGITSAYATEDKCTELTASGNAEYPPYLWRDLSRPGELTGAIRYLMDDLSDMLDLPIRVIDSGPWGRTQEEVAAGRIDLIAGAFFTEARSEWMDYVEPSLMMTQTAVWTSDEKEIDYSEWRDLIPYQGVTVIYNSFGQTFDQFAKTHLSITEVGSLEQGLLMVASQRADYLIYEDQPGLIFAQKLGVSNIKTLPRAITQQNLFLTFSKLSKCNTESLKHRISDALRIIQEEDRQSYYLAKASDSFSQN